MRALEEMDILASRQRKVEAKEVEVSVAVRSKVYARHHGIGNSEVSGLARHVSMFSHYAEIHQ